VYEKERERNIDSEGGSGQWVEEINVRDKERVLVNVFMRGG